MPTTTNGMGMGMNMNGSMNATMMMDMDMMDMNMMSDGPWYEPGVAMSVITALPYIWISRIIEILSILIISAISIMHIHTLWTFDFEEERERRSAPTSRENSMQSRSFNRQKSYSDLHRNPAIQRWTAFLNSLTIIYSIITVIVLLLVLLSTIGYSSTTTNMDNKISSCDALVKALCTLFHFSKSIFYSILITRLQVAFGVSALRYSSQVIYSLYAFVISYTFFLCIGTLFAIDGMLMNIEGDIYICHIHIHEETAVEVGVFLWIFMDMFVSVILLYLFQKPIRGLYLISGALKRVNSRLGSLMTKYAILTWLSVLWALLSLLLYLWKHMTILIEVGGPLSTVCVVLMHSKYRLLYKWMCSPCIKCVMCSCAEERTERKTSNGQVIPSGGTIAPPKLTIGSDTGVESNSLGKNERFSPTPVGKTHAFPSV